MPRPRLRSQDRSLPVRVLHGLYSFLASLELAVFVIAASAVVLVAATLVEGYYGAEAARFGIYGSWWFEALMALLAVNVLAAALIRIPWEKKQTGFVITHAGILVLLAGCLLSRLGGIDAQLPVFEEGTGSIAFEDSQHFNLTVLPRPANVSGDEAPAENIKVPFASGPFNWSDYGPGLFSVPWQLARRDRGVIYDSDGIRLEVLDYNADSRRRQAPPLVLEVAQPATDEPAGKESVKLDVRITVDPNFSQGRVAIGSRQTLSGGQRITYWVAGSTAETEAFLKSRPEGPLGELGQAVLYVRGNVFHLPVDQLQGKPSVPLGETGLEVSLDRVDRDFQGLILEVREPGSEPERMVLLADFPEFNRQAAAHGVFGSYWFDASKPEGDSETPEAAPQRADPHSPNQDSDKPRIDVVQGADRQLYYRTWTAPEFGEAGSLALDGPTSVRLPEGEGSLKLAVDEFVPHDAPGVVVEPKPFAKPRQGMPASQPMARLRLTVDGHSEEFWLEGMGSDPFRQPPQGMQTKTVAGDGRTVQVELRKDEIDVGFTLYLHDFQRKLDPGTSMASHYSSLVDVRDRNDPDKVLEKEVLITLNEPVNVADPATGRSYRLYQESFAGPWKPGDPIYNELISADSPRNQLFLSWLTVNYDPGRGLKYFGSLLICAGIATMFYMKAYFFKPKRKARPQAAQADATSPPRREPAPLEPELNRRE